MWMETLEMFALIVWRNMVETNCRRTQKEIPSGNPARPCHGRRYFLTYRKKNHWHPSRIQPFYWLNKLWPKASNIHLIIKCQRNPSKFTLIFLHIISPTKILLLRHLKSYCRCKRKNVDSLNGVLMYIFSVFYLLSQELPIFFDFEERPSIVVLSAESHKMLIFVRLFEPRILLIAKIVSRNRQDKRP
jgi:hypothetical protein